MAQRNPTILFTQSPEDNLCSSSCFQKISLMSTVSYGVDLQMDEQLKLTLKLGK